MSDLTARIMEVVARLKGEGPPAPARAESPPPPGPGPDPAGLARVLGLPLAQLDRVLRVAVPWLDVPLWFVPTEQDAEALVASGETTRGAVWTRRELLDLLSVKPMKTEARTVALAKLEMDGEVVEVRPRAARAEPAPLSPLAPPQPTRPG